jgi:hypothetical protein
MTFREWVDASTDRVREDGWQGVTESGKELYVGALRRTEPIFGHGEHVFDRDWDVLLLLDACRVDVMAEVADDYAFLDRPGTMHSVGSSSMQWIERTFSDEYRDEMQNTVYVTGNPFSKRVLEGGDLLALDEVWRYAWDDDRGTIPANPITDRAIAAGRHHDYDRLVIHYMQPHFPSIPDQLSEGHNTATLGDGEGWDMPWHMLRRGDLDEQRLWASYRANLGYVLDDVATLLQNLDAETVAISADHANAKGEWGVYGHPKVPIEAIREVPWYETSATDTGEYEPTLDPGVERGAVEEKLESLGYL